MSQSTMRFLIEIICIFTGITSDFIGVGRFRILGGGGGGAKFRILGGQGGPNSQQAHDVVMTSMRRNDVAPTSF